ncbi:PTS sugar transporter subunit IIA [Alkalibacterium kapii]|uniref:PTS mannose transporter subunit IIAB n=1 Tax=Alkalibacterium kapii TaxID=426704 RepID=A0A511ARL3_9LACT|nr:fructose PTS transporter subunit IIA [Alkalibacterium kapii]GEK90845.1 PTS mannose transporter subunit IIAB [Alkalibacterium kapii]
MNEAVSDGVDTYINPSKRFKSTEKKEIFREIIDEVVDQTAYKLDKDEITADIAKREALSTTGFGNGLAIPHGKSSQIHKPLVVLMKTDQALEWEALDEKPVSIIFLLIIPKEKGETIHLKLLSRLSYHLMDKDVQDKVKKAETKKRLKEILNELLN